MVTHVVADRVKETTTTTGTGDLTLAGAVTGYRAFSAVLSGTTNRCPYALQAVDGSGVPTGDWEVGIGTYSGANTLTRTTVLSSSTGSVLNLAAGTKEVWIDVPAALSYNIVLAGQTITETRTATLANYAYGYKCTAKFTGVAHSLRTRNFAAGNIKLGIYSHNAGTDLPDTLLGYCEGTALTGNLELTIPLVAPVSITAGTIYWMALLSDTANFLTSSNMANGRLSYNSNAYADGLPATWVSGSVTTHANDTKAIVF